MKRTRKQHLETEQETLAGLLQRFRADEPSIGAALIVDDVHAKKLLAAFALVPLPHWKCPRGNSPVDARQLWEWLWHGFAGGPDNPHFLGDIAAAAGLSIQTAHSKWAMIRMSRLVYPDGTLSAKATQVLDAFVASNLPKPPRQPVATAPVAPPPPAPKESDDGK